ncbi:uncharacterized protein MONBRDRAFT_7470 [Monosiga brevicollis MX1]|uniref:Secreted protein n=1 Tax=Monosiga brevicollis TaxID=81824 RepID=A9UX21_MONBE|nr:uncharacterized protein MONBRDRAFT_7470 [Monosiga brevicollis MX1]EDQ90317.1 predicted protein [Monosiga brevicollis MX1]|eukprot:XP_001745084.1 hypothetical protein [Monosiga brevicollis MX1]
MRIQGQIPPGLVLVCLTHLFASTTNNHELPLWPDRLGLSLSGDCIAFGHSRVGSSPARCRPTNRPCLSQCGTARDCPMTVGTISHGGPPARSISSMWQQSDTRDDFEISHSAPVLIHGRHLAQAATSSLFRAKLVGLVWVWHTANESCHVPVAGARSSGRTCPHRRQHVKFPDFSITMARQQH